MITWKHKYPDNHNPDPDMLVTIDPGKLVSGYAMFFEKKLKACGLAKDAADILQYGVLQPGLIVMEYPKVYDRRRWKGDPNDLLPITAAGAFLAGVLQPTRLKIVHPEEWKGQTPKEIQNARDQGVLSPDEVEVLESVPVAAGKMHNVIDAVGIGLWELKRNAI